MRLSSIDEILSDFSKGQFVILVDDENRENEGDLVCAAELVDEKKINFMMRESCGLICLAMSAKQIDQLQLPLMKSELHQSPNNHAAFTYSIEAKNTVGTGISAGERANTIKVAASKAVKPTDVVSPGHVFPLRAAAGGLAQRQGHTEASVELARLAGFSEASVICEIIDLDGNAANNAYLKNFSDKHHIKIGKIADLLKFIESKGL